MTGDFLVHLIMDRIVISFLFINPVLDIYQFALAQSKFLASACYGTPGPCYHIYLNYSLDRSINILRAYYLFNDNPQCRNETCENKLKNGCCDPKKGKDRTPYHKNHMVELEDGCSRKSDCSIHAQWTNNDKGASSSMVEVHYDCKSEDPPKFPIDRSPEDDTDSDSSSIAPIVAPIVVVLLIAAAATVFFFWRRKQRTKGEKTDANQANQILHTPVSGYSDIDDTNRVSEDVTKDVLENTYHSIDPSTLPDKVMAKEYSGAEDNMRDPKEIIR